MLGSKRKVQSVPDNLAQVAEAQERKVTRLGDWLGARAAKPDSYHALQDQDEKKQTAAEFRVVAWNFLAERLTVLQWLPYYDWRSNFFYDLSGGTTIALICLVQTLAHASIATTKVIQGPYCAFVPPFVYAMLGTSPHASISSGAIAAILIADQLRFYDSIEDRTQLASLLAFISGGMLVVMGLLNAAYAVRFLSQSLISGFVTGGSVLIIIGQLKNLFGLVYQTHPIGFLPTVVALVTALPGTNFVGLGLGLSMLGLLQVMMWIKKSVTDRLKKKGPHPQWLNPVKILTEMKELVLVGTSIIFAYATTDENGEPLLPVVGWIPQGLPPFQNPMGLEASQDLLYGRHYRLREFILGGFLVAMTSFLTTYATSKKQALKHGYNIDAAQEMVALGMAGVCGSCFGSFSPSGSLSRTSLASEVGVKTQMSGLMKIVVVGTALKFLTPVLYYLPHATLAAIILRSTWLLVDTKTPRELWREWKPYQQGGMRRDLVVWWTAFLLTIFMGVLYGIGVSVFASLVMIVRDAAMPRVVRLGCLELARGSSVWRDKEVWPEGKVEPGILVAEVRGPLSFASADHFVESIELKRRAESAQQNMIEVVVLALGSVHDLDATAIQTLRELLTEWRLQGVQCIVGDAKSRVRLLMEQNFAQGSKPLLDQPAFMVSLDEAVHLAKRCIAIKALRRGQQNTADGTTPSPNHNLSGPALDAESLFLRSASSKFT